MGCKVAKNKIRFIRSRLRMIITNVKIINLKRIKHSITLWNYSSYKKFGCQCCAEPAIIEK